VKGRNAERGPEAQRIQQWEVVLHGNSSIHETIVFQILYAKPETAQHAELAGLIAAVGRASLNIPQLTSKSRLWVNSRRHITTRAMIGPAAPPSSILAS
jgi:hypothetical protein